MKKLDTLKLSLLAASVAGLGVGCASSGYARMDDNRGTGAGMNAEVAGLGASASAEMGTDRGYSTDRTYSTTGHDHYMGDSSDREGSSRITVSALSFTPETRAEYVNRFPFYEQAWNLRTISTYTFAVPDPEVRGTSSNLPEFSENLPPGSVFVESAGGAGEVRTGRVIQHSPNPR